MVHSQTIETYGHTIAGRRSFVTPGRFFCLFFNAPLYHYLHVCMNQIQKKRIYYPSLNLFVSCNLYKQMLQDAINSVVHKICDVLNFLEIREMIRISSNLANLCSIITFCLSAAHLLNEVLAD